MSDLISRQAALVFIQSLYPGIPLAPFNKKKWREKYKQYIEVEIGLTNLPSVEPKKGKWVPDGFFKDEPSMWKCSCCGASVYRTDECNYCYNCGAKMEKE